MEHVSQKALPSLLLPPRYAFSFSLIRTPLFMNLSVHMTIPILRSTLVIVCPFVSLPLGRCPCIHIQNCANCAKPSKLSRTGRGLLSDGLNQSMSFLSVDYGDL